MICDSPIYVQPKAGTSKVPVPCGKCPNCKRRRVNSWVFRLLEEDKISSGSHFVTLTYDTRYVPISDNGFMTLKKKNFQDYMKRLRKLAPGVTLKYYAVGEYGTQNKRPHYHAIIFNCPNAEFFYDAWHLDGDPLGAVHVGQVSGDSIAYTMKYIDKLGSGKMHARDDRAPEFALMSKGLGGSYLTPESVHWHRSDLSNTFITNAAGYKIALPRYYAQKIYSDSQRELQMLLAENASVQVDRDSYEKFRALKYDLSAYPAYKDSQRLGRYNRFYSQQKNRDL